MLLEKSKTNHDRLCCSKMYSLGSATVSGSGGQFHDKTSP